MRSVNLGPDLEGQLEEVSQITGESVSEIIREAVRRRCDEVLSERLDRRLADVIGLVSVGGNCRKTGQVFAAHLQRKSGGRRRNNTSGSSK